MIEPRRFKTMDNSPHIVAQQEIIVKEPSKKESQKNPDSTKKIGGSSCKKAPSKKGSVLIEPRPTQTTILREEHFRKKKLLKESAEKSK